jgi:riboflavin synthase
MTAQLMTSRHILEVFVHERESPDPVELLHICTERCRKHALNAHALLFEPEQLAAGSGQGLRHGGPNVGPLS